MPRRSSGTIPRAKRPSGANLLRAAAAANSAKAAGDPMGAKGTSAAGTVARSSSESVVWKVGERRARRCFGCDVVVLECRRARTFGLLFIIHVPLGIGGVRRTTILSVAVGDNSVETSLRGRGS